MKCLSQMRVLKRLNYCLVRLLINGQKKQVMHSIRYLHFSACVVLIKLSFLFKAEKLTFFDR